MPLEHVVIYMLYVVEIVLKHVVSGSAGGEGLLSDQGLGLSIPISFYFQASSRILPTLFTPSRLLAVRASVSACSLLPTAGCRSTYFTT